MRRHLLYINDDQTLRVIMHRAHGSNDGVYILQKNNSQWVDEDRVNSWDKMALDRVEKWVGDNNLNGSVITTRENVI